MDVYTAIKMMAMKAVISPDEGAIVRRIQRWYSKTFHTPLADVEKIDFFELLTHYYEDTYETAASSEDGMSISKALQEEFHQLLMTPEEEMAKLSEKELEDFESFQLLKAVREEEDRAAAEFEKKQKEIKVSNLAATPPVEQAPPPIPPAISSEESMNFDGLDGEDQE